MNLIVEALHKRFKLQITLQHSAGMLNEISIEKDKKLYNLNEIAQITMKSHDLFIINMTFHPDLLPKVEKALMISGMNLGIQKEGNHIYITIPKITHEYKENLSKSAKHLSQKSKDQIRDLQNSLIKEIYTKEGSYSKDIILDSKLKVL
ncbi:unnamed protein product [Gordionus sp. m RMFG-2023]